MAEEEQRRGDPGVEIAGAAYLPQLVMEDIAEKLKLLNYEQEFCLKQNQRPIPRNYFAVAAVAGGEQFFIFSSLLSWLLSICGRHFEAPLEDDDPNAVISNITGEIRSLGLNTDFPPSRLKTGYGGEVCYILDQLTDKALKAAHFQWDRPEHLEEDAQEESVEEDEEEPGDELGEGVEEDYEDEIILDVDATIHSAGVPDLEKQEELLESNTDALEWKLEVERVMPSLKVHLRADKDWRSHLDHMLEYKKNMSLSLTDTKTQLDQMHTEITRTLEKIGSREKYINSQMEGQLTEFRHLQDRLSEIKERYRIASTTVNSQSRELSQITEELESVKSQMDEKGTTMSDSGPVVKIKQALTRMKNEIVHMELRIGVLQHVVMTSKMNDKSIMQRDMNADPHFSDLKTF